MASLDDTEIAILLMLYEEAEVTGRRLAARGVANKFQPRITERIADIALRHLKQCQLIEGSFDNPTDAGFSISRLGREVVESTHERRHDGTDTSWIRRSDQNLAGPLEADLASHLAIDSSQWTGVPSRNALNEERSAKLVRFLDEAEQQIADLLLGQEERAQARAFIVASRVLAEAPEPPADLIWILLQRLNNIAGIASLFISMMALFQAAAH